MRLKYNAYKGSKFKNSLVIKYWNISIDKKYFREISKFLRSYLVYQEIKLDTILKLILQVL